MNILKEYTHVFVSVFISMVVQQVFWALFRGLIPFKNLMQQRRSNLLVGSLAVTNGYNQSACLRQGHFWIFDFLASLIMNIHVSMNILIPLCFGAVGTGDVLL